MVFFINLTLFFLIAAVSYVVFSVFIPTISYESTFILATFLAITTVFFSAPLNLFLASAKKLKHCHKSVEIYEKILNHCFKLKLRSPKIFLTTESRIDFQIHRSLTGHPVLLINQDLYNKLNIHELALICRWLLWLSKTNAIPVISYAHLTESVFRITRNFIQKWMPIRIVNELIDLMFYLPLLSLIKSSVIKKEELQNHTKNVLSHGERLEIFSLVVKVKKQSLDNKILFDTRLSLISILGYQDEIDFSSLVSPDGY